jgi:hypothetical protein
MLDCVLRDAEVHELTREMVMLRGSQGQREIRGVLGEALPRDGDRAGAALDLALDFRAWQRLTRSGLSSEEAVETMVAAILAQ